MKTIKNILSLATLVMFVVLCTTSYLQAAGSSAKYIGGSLVQAAQPDPRAVYDFYADTDAAGSFPLAGKIWFEFTSPKDCKGWILETNDRTVKRGFTIKADKTIDYVVNPNALFFNWTGCGGAEGKSQ